MDTDPPPHPLLQGEALKEAGRKFLEELQAKMEKAQLGVGTFYDHALLDLMAKLEHLERDLSWEDNVAQLSGSVDELRQSLQRLQLLLSRRAQGRFVDYQVRSLGARALYGNTDISYFDLITSQGAFDCMQWKGMPLFKTVYDFSIYAMLLWALHPKTIIELGSGSGASAIWLADLTRTFGIDCRLYSVDLNRPDIEHDAIRFIQGDCRTIERVFDEEFLRSAAHPWLLIEDAHVNVGGVLRHFHPYIASGDYVVVEDSAGKQEDIGGFLEQAAGSYKVDTYYTDFFGRNVTCAQDSILVRI